MPSPLASQLTQRFFRYLAISSQSDPRATTLPTTPGQHEMARELADELHRLGLDDIVIDDHATVTAVKEGMFRARRGLALSPTSTPWTSGCPRTFIHKFCVLPARICA